MNRFRLFVILMILFPVVGCQTGHCRRSQKNIPQVQLPENPEAKGKKATSRKVSVYKYDGSLQCGQGKAVPLKAMAEALSQKDIKIFNMEKKPDGLMHIQVCGSPTGIANVYEISEADLGRATALGFKKWTFYE